MLSPWPRQLSGNAVMRGLVPSPGPSDSESHAHQRRFRQIFALSSCLRLSRAASDMSRHCDAFRICGDPHDNLVNHPLMRLLPYRNHGRCRWPTGKGQIVAVWIPSAANGCARRFSQGADEHRSDAIWLIVADALTAYGLLPAEETLPMKRDRAGIPVAPMRRRESFLPSLVMAELVQPLRDL
jgi:hypothetical protein